jgi:Family of unknown function (DUF6088)
MIKRLTPPAHLKDRIARYVLRRRSGIFFREDFNDFGSYAQIGKVLRVLVSDGKLIRIGHGIYVRTMRSTINGRMIPDRGMREITEEVLARLGVRTTPTDYEIAYNSGKSTQVPTGRVVGVLSRVRRRIRYGGIEMTFQRVSPRLRAE